MAKQSAEHGRIVHSIGNGRSIAFDATIRDPEVDKIFDPVIEEVNDEASRTNREVRERNEKIRSRRRRAAGKRSTT